MEPRERARRRPRPSDTSDGDDARDALPWLQDEAPPRSAAPPRPVQPPRSGGRGPWWSRLIGGDTELPQKRPGRPFDGPTDAETVVASRDELLRAVREYMGGRKSPLLDGAAGPPTPAVPEAPALPEAPAVPEAAALPEAPAVIRRTAARAPIDDLEAPQEAPAEPFETRKMKAPLVPPPAAEPATRKVKPAQVTPPAGEFETRKMKAPLVPPGQVARAASPPQGPPEAAPRRGGDIFDVLESRRGQSSAPGDGASPPSPRPPGGPSAMSRERVLPATGKPKRRVEPAAPSEPSLSSFSLGEDSRDKTPYPQEFITNGLRLLMTRQWGPALDFYREETKRNPNDAHMLYGQAAALLALDRLEEAAPCLVKAHDIEPAFPMARLIGDACPDDPVAWYNLAAALVAERNRSAYLCAEVVLTECLGGAHDDQLRGRAQRVQRDIARMLDQRSKRDEMHREDVPWHHVLLQPAVLAGIFLAILVIGMVWRTLAPGPPTASPSAPAASPSPSASARIVASPLPARKR